MFFLDKLKNEIASYLEVSSQDLLVPPDIKLGHLSLPLFNLAKIKKINPVELAQEKKKILEAKKNNLDYIEDLKVVGPYLNIYFNKEKLIQKILKNILLLKNIYGKYPSSGSLSMIEYANQNTHKNLHIGHIRNISYGDALFKILKSSGRRLVAVSFINDQGINVAKTVWNWQREKKYSQSIKEKGQVLADCYSEAVKKIGDNEDLKKEVAEVMRAIEKKQGNCYQIWRQTRQFSIDYFNQVYKELGIKFDKIFYESQMVDRGLKIVKDLLVKKILDTSDGAIIADLKKEGLEVMPILRSDGTALYPVADLALALNKFELYSLDESIYVIDVRQSLHFKQLFKILEKMGYKQKLIHLSYDFVKLKEGMMSSRLGNSISYEQAFSSIYNKTKEETAIRHKGWSEKRINKIAKQMTISTLKFEMIKVSPNKIITFDIDSSIRFDGYTVAYLQYSGARINSLLNKGLNIFSRFFLNFKADKLSLEIEIKLALMLAQYPEKIKQSANDYNPSILSRYLFDLCSLFNDYYQSVNILKAEKSTKLARLALLLSIQQVLKNAFKILGLKYLKEM